MQSVNTMSDLTISPYTASTFESIFKQFLSTDGVLTFPEFDRFIEIHPSIYLKLISVFRETIWKDYTIGIKSPGPVHICENTRKELKPSIIFSGTILIGLTDPLKEYFAVIKNDFFMVYKSDKLSEICEVVILSDCYLRTEQSECSIWQYFCDKPRIIFKSNPSIAIETWVKKLTKAGHFKKFRDHYELGDRIGYGKYSDVHLAVENATKKLWVVKIMKQKHVNSVERVLIHNEITVLKILHHKNIVKIKESFNNSTFTLLVEEYLEGKTLRESLGKLNENQIKEIIKQILHVLKYIHEAGIIHGDIKLENILFTKNNKTDVKVVDFGLSSYIIPGKKHQRIVGTIGYTAPEMILKSGFNEAVDVWSLGVVAYALLLQKLPYEGNNEQEIISATIDYEPDFSEFKKFSANSKDFVKKLLEKSPNLRLTASEALNHPWLLS